jgi:hypothetical protein
MLPHSFYLINSVGAVALVGFHNCITTQMATNNNKIIYLLVQKSLVSFLFLAFVQVKHYWYSHTGALCLAASHNIHSLTSFHGINLTCLAFQWIKKTEELVSYRTRNRSGT